MKPSVFVLILCGILGVWAACDCTPDPTCLIITCPTLTISSHSQVIILFGNLDVSSAMFNPAFPNLVKITGNVVMNMNSVVTVLDFPLLNWIGDDTFLSGDLYLWSNPALITVLLPRLTDIYGKYYIDTNVNLYTIDFTLLANVQSGFSPAFSHVDTAVCDFCSLCTLAQNKPLLDVSTDSSSVIYPWSAFSSSCGDHVSCTICPPAPSSSSTPSASTSSTRTMTATPSSSRTLSATPSTTRTMTATPSSSRTLSATPSTTRTMSATPSTTRTMSATPSTTRTMSATPSNSRTPTRTPSNSRTPTRTPSTSASNSPSPSASAAPSCPPDSQNITFRYNPACGSDVILPDIGEQIINSTDLFTTAPTYGTWGPPTHACTYLHTQSPWFSSTADRTFAKALTTITEGLSVMFWLRTSGATNNFQTIMSTRLTNNGATPQIEGSLKGWNIYVNTNFSANPAWYAEGNGPFLGWLSFWWSQCGNVTTANPITHGWRKFHILDLNQYVNGTVVPNSNLNEFMHIAIVYDNTQKIVTAYQDGIAIRNQTAASMGYWPQICAINNTDVYSGAPALRFGQNNENLFYPANLDLGDIRIYDRTVSEAEIIIAAAQCA